MTIPTGATTSVDAISNGDDGRVTRVAGNMDVSVGDFFSVSGYIRPTARSRLHVA
jgi:hypothetical protein